MSDLALVWAILIGIAGLFTFGRKWLGLALTPEQERSLKAIALRPPLSDEEFVSRMGEKTTDQVIVERVRYTLARESLVGFADKKDGRLIYPEDRLWEDLAIGAVDYLEYGSILLDLERDLGIRIPDEEAEQVRTVEDLVRLCSKCLHRRQQG